MKTFKKDLSLANIPSLLKLLTFFSFAVMGDFQLEDQFRDSDCRGLAIVYAWYTVSLLRHGASLCRAGTFTD